MATVPASTDASNGGTGDAVATGAGTGAGTGAAAFSTMLVATDGGLAWLEQQVWTLEEKAEAMHAKLPRHDRHGLVAGCALPAFGDTSSTACTDDDNNGLWTSIVAAAEYFRYAVTKDPRAAASAAHFLGGLQLLHNITGIRGLYARSACAPSDGPSCAADRAHHRQACGADVSPGCCVSPGGEACGLQWRNATAPGPDLSNAPFPMIYAAKACLCWRPRASGTSP